MPLTEMQVRLAKGREKPYKLTDGEGLYLLVKPSGARYWRYKYRRDGKEFAAPIGIYPAVGLKDARKRLDAFKKSAVAGDAGVLGDRGTDVATFAQVMSDWMTRKVCGVLAAETVAKTEWILKFAEPLNSRDITQIKAIDVLEVLRRVEAQGRHETARRLRSVLSRIWRYAVATSRAERDVCADLVDALTPVTTKHRAAPLSPDKIGDLLRSMRGYEGAPGVKCAMLLGAYTFVRPYELRYAVWDEFDIPAAIWRIPAERMKMKRDHIVPLSHQSLAILVTLKEMFVPKGLLFPSLRSDDRPISENTINAALRRLGYSKEEATHHGFRRMASTTLNERGWNRDWVEAQLAHSAADKIRGAYNAAGYLEGRITMMQAWADALDEFEADEDLIG